MPSNCIGTLKSKDENFAFYCKEGHFGILCEDCDIY
jgi:hypothetical protein